MNISGQKWLSHFEDLAESSPPVSLNDTPVSRTFLSSTRPRALALEESDDRHE